MPHSPISAKESTNLAMSNSCQIPIPLERNQFVNKEFLLNMDVMAFKTSQLPLTNPRTDSSPKFRNTGRFRNGIPIS